jgi:hypothetical protein
MSSFWRLWGELVGDGEGRKEGTYRWATVALLAFARVPVERAMVEVCACVLSLEVVEMLLYAELLRSRAFVASGSGP